jgi:hypothetical protein
MMGSKSNQASAEREVFDVGGVCNGNLVTTTTLFFNPAFLPYGHAPASDDIWWIQSFSSMNLQ